MRVCCVAGARPNFMKVAPVVSVLEERGIEVVLVHTGQHYDSAMSDVFFSELGLRSPDHFLGVGPGTHAEQTASVMRGFEPVLARVEPDAVVVVGDVNSTMAAALVSAKAVIPVAHVEAGLRSREWAMPEEVNRVVTDRVSHWLLAPSPDAVDNLRAEGCSEERIFLVGNTMVDTLLKNRSRAERRPTLPELGLTQGAYAVATLHRPSNVDEPRVLGGLLGALGRVAERLPVIYPAHPRVTGRLPAVPPGVVVIEPRGYLDMLALLGGAALVLTDSGGIQEETTVLGVPCLTLRQQTERPVTVDEGTNQVVGTDPDRIVAAAGRVLDHGVAPRCPPLWDGKAAERIASALLGPVPPHPTAG